MFCSGLVCVSLEWAGILNLAQFGKPCQVNYSKGSVMEVGSASSLESSDSNVKVQIRQFVAACFRFLFLKSA